VKYTVLFFLYFIAFIDFIVLFLISYSGLATAVIAFDFIFITNVYLISNFGLNLSASFIMTFSRNLQRFFVNVLNIFIIFQYLFSFINTVKKIL